MLQSMYHLMQQLGKSGTESTLKWVENNSSTYLSGDKEVGNLKQRIYTKMDRK